MMPSRRSRRTVIAVCALSLLPLVAHAAAPAAPAPAAAAPVAPAPAAQPNPNYSVNQTVGDWVVRCVASTIKSPTPCEVVQVRARDNQRVSSFSLAYVPGRDSYALQIVVPTGVQLSKGLALAAGDHSLNGIHFNRCERDGCYVELLTDQATVNALSAVGKETSISVNPYGQTNAVKIPVSLTGFSDALERMKSYSKDKAAPLPAAAAPAAAKAPPPKAPARPAEHR